MYFHGDSIKHFVCQSFRIVTSSPLEYLCEIVTKLDIHRRSDLPIRMEPGENFLEAFR